MLNMDPMNGFADSIDRIRADGGLIGGLFRLPTATAFAWLLLVAVLLFVALYGLSIAMHGREGGRAAFMSSLPWFALAAALVISFIGAIFAIVPICIAISVLIRGPASSGQSEG